MDLIKLKEDEGSNTQAARTEAVASGNKEHQKDEKQQQSFHMEPIGYMDFNGAQFGPSYMVKKYEAKIKQKVEERVGLFSEAEATKREEEAVAREKEETAGWEKSKNVYEF